MGVHAVPAAVIQNPSPKFTLVQVQLSIYHLIRTKTLLPEGTLDTSALPVMMLMYVATLLTLQLATTYVLCTRFRSPAAEFHL